MTYTDADIETAALHERARAAAIGVCLHCDEALDPHDPKWRIDPDDAASIDAAYGGISDTDPHYHDRCFTEAWNDR